MPLQPPVEARVSKMQTSPDRHEDVNLDTLVEKKHNYNTRRPQLHGKSY